MFGFIFHFLFMEYISSSETTPNFTKYFHQSNQKCKFISHNNCIKLKSSYSVFKKQFRFDKKRICYNCLGSTHTFENATKQRFKIENITRDLDNFTSSFRLYKNSNSSRNYRSNISLANFVFASNNNYEIFYLKNNRCKT